MDFDLAKFIKQFAYKTGRFTLASGDVASEYLDVKNIILHPVTGRALTQVVARKIQAFSQQEKVDAVAGVVLGGALLAKDVARDLSLPCLAVRTQLKDHGLPDFVVGLDNVHGLGEVVPQVVLVEDVITRGTSVLQALSFLQQQLIKVSYVLAVCDRELGGLDSIRRVYPYLQVEALTTLSDVRRF